jgi:hypothetical protein
MAISSEADAEIRRWTAENAEKNQRVARTELRHYWHDQPGDAANGGSADSLILGHKSEPGELKHHLLEETVRDLRELLQGVLAELIFNLNEAAISD